MRKLIDSTLQTVKRISTDLRPELLDDLGLSAAIEWQGEEFQNRTGIKCGMTIDPEEIILDRERSTAIFRIFQETLTNVARHANATRVAINLKMKTAKIELKIKDNGEGITEKQISNPKSFGLIGIRERVHFLDGDVKIKGVQDKGTTVTVRIPIPKEGNAG
jgi:signal transduction histidine kinase